MSHKSGRHVTIIAEAGVNHNGSLQAAKQLADVAAAAYADSVKFQTFSPDSLVTAAASAADYQRAGGFENQREMLSQLTLSGDELAELKQYCEFIGISFLSTAFDLGSVSLLAELGQRVWKIPSGEITNVPLIEAIGAIADEVILSTGMATLGEIERAIDWLEEVGCDRDRITVLHCNTEYPTPYADVNLLAMNTIGSALGVRVGYSDHTMGTEVPIAAVALGATVIEKHFTLDRTLPGPDQTASLEPHELAEMVWAVRNIEKAVGRREKRVSESEKKNLMSVRKGIYAACPIERGALFTKDNITTKRPAHQVDASQWHRLLGRTASKTYSPDEAIEW